jgi:hypothetical protein
MRCILKGRGAIGRKFFKNPVCGDTKVFFPDFIERIAKSSVIIQYIKK